MITVFCAVLINAPFYDNSSNASLNLNIKISRTYGEANHIKRIIQFFILEFVVYFLDIIG